MVKRKTNIKGANYSSLNKIEDFVKPPECNDGGKTTNREYKYLHGNTTKKHKRRHD